MSELLLLTSPPASGKTFWIESYACELSEKILVISPLRALADECRKNWKDRIDVMTPEEWILKKTTSSVVIFDEFHLLKYWGDTFRPLMWEVFFELSLGAELVIGLTATVSEEFKADVDRLSDGFDKILWCDHGNQRLKWFPEKYFCLKKPNLEKAILHLPPIKTSLIFCAYRSEVEFWEKRLRAEGFSTWGCRGGEASAFSERVELEKAPDFIVATTVLSHGVNLPTIRRVFFLYPVGNIDFWIQMMARGGRRGEKFEVFALEPPHGLRWTRWKNFSSGICLSIRVSYSVFLGQLEQCFLKE